nr:MAG TPA: hypothetical protein [Caudoviricetes sp.]
MASPRGGCSTYRAAPSLLLRVPTAHKTHP